MPDLVPRLSNLKAVWNAPTSAPSQTQTSERNHVRVRARSHFGCYGKRRPAAVHKQLRPQKTRQPTQCN